MEAVMFWKKIMAYFQEIAVTSNETTTSSSSQTVVGYSSNGGTQISMNGGIGGLAESVKNSVFGFLTPSKEKVLPAIVESSESGYEEGSVIGKGTNSLFFCKQNYFYSDSLCIVTVVVFEI